MKRYYTGIGARKTPPEIMVVERQVASSLERHGYILRSGGAAGSDTAFEQGVIRPTNKRIYLPWHGFNGRASKYNTPTREAIELASRYHPAWEKLGQASRKLMGRNSHQVLGYDLVTPSEFIICWTPGGEMVGGTSQALRIGLDHKIPIINLGAPQADALLEALLALTCEEPEVVV